MIKFIVDFQDMLISAEMNIQIYQSLNKKKVYQFARKKETICT